MDFNAFTLQSPARQVKKQNIPDSKSGIVLSSRVRLARNLAGIPFPGWSLAAHRKASLKTIIQAIDRIPSLKKGMFFAEMSDLEAPQKLYLVEQHLVSRELATRHEGCAVVINKNQDVSLMINEEDHLRLQVILPGLQIDKAWEKANRLDTQLEEYLDYAYSPAWGYLTACLTNLGTGMRASAMLHLPGLVFSKNIIPVMEGARKLGLTVRGQYGEGSQCLSSLFQISNQKTLGKTEEQITEQLKRIVKEIIKHELNARDKLLETRTTRHYVYDMIGRAFGTLSHAYSLSTQETLNLISLLRLGYDLGIVEATDSRIFDDLTLLSQPAHILQKSQENELPLVERDIRRAELTRNCLRQFSFIQ